MANRVAVLNAKAPQTPTGQSRLHSRWAEERILPGDRVIFPIWMAPSQAAGVRIQLSFDEDDQNPATRQPSAGNQPVLMETASIETNNFKLHIAPSVYGWNDDANAVVASRTEVPAAGEALEAGEIALWFPKALAIDTDADAAAFQGVYRGHHGIVLVSSNNGSWQAQEGAPEVLQMAKGEGMRDAPPAAWMVCNPLNGLALTANCFIH